MRYVVFVMPILIVILASGSFCYKAGYHKAKSQFNDTKLPYSIVDANGVEHRTACQGYDLINSDSIMLCNGVKLKYSKKKPINVKQK